MKGGGEISRAVDISHHIVHIRIASVAVNSSTTFLYCCVVDESSRVMDVYD